MSTTCKSIRGVKPVIFDVDGKDITVDIDDHPLQKYTGCLYEDTLRSMPESSWTPIEVNLCVFLENENAHSRLKDEYNLDYDQLLSIMKDPKNAH